MRRLLAMLPLLIALLMVGFGTVSVTETADAAPQQSLRLREVGGYGLVLRNTPVRAYGSLDSAVVGQAAAGRVVYLNGWQIGVYHIGDNQWVAARDVQPIIDAWGTPMVNYVSKSSSGGYLMNGQALAMPARHVPMAERFLRNPTVNAPILWQGSRVPSDVAGNLVDPGRVWHSPGQKVVATMRVTDIYNFIYLRTGPSADAPLADIVANQHEILTAYEVRGDWYRIGTNVWAPRTWGGETLLVPENVAAYAPAEYYNGSKWISIDLDRQQLTAWEGADVIAAARIKSGKYGYHTPAGVWRTWAKIPNERMSGSDYDLADVAWTQYFTGSGIAIHAAYWHNNYNGRPGSHGCVNTPVDVAEKLFHWAPLGTTVVTHNLYQFDAQDIRDAQKWSEFER